LLNIEGLGRQLYPELNLWDTAQPFLEEWVQQRYSPQSVFKRLQRHAPSWLEQLPQLPEALLESLQQSRKIDHHLRPLAPPTDDKRQQQEQLTRRRRFFLGGIACVAAAATALPGFWQNLAQAPFITWLLAAVGISLLWPRDR
jgi:ubiquinone biosynthesis protein